MSKKAYCKSKAQISVEYLVILGISLAVLIPAGYFFYKYSQNSNDEAIRQQINQIGQEMLDNSESIYGLSEGSLISIDLRYPNNIRNMYVLKNYELIIVYEISSGISEAVFFSKVPLSGEYNMSYASCTPPCENSTFYNLAPQPGKHSIKMASKTSYVQITQLT